MRLWALRLLALVAWGIALLLYLRGGEVPGCGAEAGCGQVLSSRWSAVAGVPVSLPAMLTHAGILVLSAFTHHRWAMVMLRTLVLAAALAGVWFIALQAYEGAWCPWCCAAHACAFLMVPVVLSLKDRHEAQPVTGWASGGMAPVVVALLLTAALITTQLVQPASAPEPLRFAGFTDLRPEDYPLIGSADAPRLVAVLYDPLCPHCRVTHGHLREAMRERNGAFAIALLPVPFSDRCNPHMSRTPAGFEDSCELVRLQLALWIADPVHTDRFDAFLFSDVKRPPSLSDARKLAEHFVGPDALASAMQDPRLEQALRRNTDVFDLLGRGVPRLLIAGKAYPAPATLDQLLALLDHALPLAADTNP